MEMQDYGIYLEIFGFIMLLLVSGRNPVAQSTIREPSMESPFDRFRSKIVPDKLINVCLVWGIGAIVIGLSFQLGFFNP